VRAQQIATRDVWHAVLHRDAACLGAFAGADWTKKNEIKAPPGRAIEPVSGQ
jgi:hypothetical protein